MKHYTLKTLLATLLLLCHYGIATHSHAQASFFDPTFGVGGVTTITSSDIVDGRFEAVAIQPDGKIVTAGVINSQATIARFKVNGTPDSSFATNGFFTWPVIGSSLSDLRIKADGNIIAVGSVYVPSANVQFLSVYLNNAGIPISSWGTTGVLTTDLGPLTNDNGYSIIVQPDDKVVLAGETAPANIASVRLHPTGVIDSSFAVNGIEKSTYGRVRDIAIAPDGKMVLGGNATASHGYVLLAMRYLPDGTLDTSFNHTGVVYTNAGGAGKSVRLLADGKILLAGSGSAPGEGGNFVLVRYNTDGSPDNTFGVDGVADVDFNGAEDKTLDMSLAPDGKIVMTGMSGPYMAYKIAVARLDVNGLPDATFGVGGRIVVSMANGNEYARGVAVQADNKVVVVGNTCLSTSCRAFVARFLPATNKVPEKTMHDVAVYPNPAQDIVFIDAPTLSAISQILICSTIGYQLPINYLPGASSVSVSNLPNGLYLMKFVYADGSIRMQRLVVQH